MHPQRNLIEAAGQIVLNEFGLPPKPYDHTGHENQFVDAAEKLNSGSGPGSIDEMETVEKIHNPLVHHAKAAHKSIIEGIREADAHTQGALDKPEINDTEVSKIAASLHTDNPHYGNIDPNFHGALRTIASNAIDHHFNGYKESIAGNPAHVKTYGGSVDHHEGDFRDHVRRIAAGHHDYLSTPRHPGWDPPLP